MKFCPAVPEICRGQVHGARKERRRIRRRRIRIIIIIIRRNGAKTISLPNNKSPRLNKIKNTKNNTTQKIKKMSNMDPKKKGRVAFYYIMT